MYLPSTSLYVTSSTTDKTGLPAQARRTQLGGMRQTRSVNGIPRSAQSFHHYRHSSSRLNSLFHHNKPLAQYTVNLGEPSHGGAEKRVCTNTFCMPSSFLSNL